MNSLGAEHIGKISFRRREGKGDSHVKEMLRKTEDTGRLIHSSRVDTDKSFC